MIYKIFRGPEWASASAGADFSGSPLDLKDGFIHFSTAGQAAGTLAAHFAGEAGLVLAEIDPARLGIGLKWEPARGGALFPHLYGSMPLAAVARTWVLSVGPGGRHELPGGLT